MAKYKKSKNRIGTTGIIAFLVLLAIIQKKNSVFKMMEDQVRSESFLIVQIAGMLILIAVLGMAIPTIIKRYQKAAKKKIYLKSNIHNIDHMSGEDFERYLKAHFEKIGYRVSTTPASNDYGADLVLTKNNEKVIVQAKRYTGKIGNKAIQEATGALGFYGAGRGMVVTNSYFTSNAVKLAKANHIELWDRNTLIHKFQIPQ